MTVPINIEELNKLIKERDIIYEKQISELYDKIEQFETVNTQLIQNIKGKDNLIEKYNQENEKLKEEIRNYSLLFWYIYCGSEDNLAEDVIGEYYNAKNECDNKYLDIFWKKIGNLEQTEYRLKKHSYKQALEEIREYINSQGIDNKLNMKIQRFRMEILNKINEVLK